MKLVFVGIFASLFILGCSDQPRRTAYIPLPPTPPAPQPDPVDPKPKEPSPIFSCTGTGEFSKIEIWWSKTNPVKDVNLGSLNKCKNTIPDDGFDMVLKFPAEGSTLEVDGESKTLWMMAKIFDDQGNERRFYQYSDFFNRSNGCSQGQFISEESRVIEIRVNEPKIGSGTLISDNAEIVLICPRR